MQLAQCSSRPCMETLPEGSPHPPPKAPSGGFPWDCTQGCRLIYLTILICVQVISSFSLLQCCKKAALPTCIHELWKHSRWNSRVKGAHLCTVRDRTGLQTPARGERVCPICRHASRTCSGAWVSVWPSSYCWWTREPSSALGPPSL